MNKRDFIEYVKGGIDKDGFNPFPIFWQRHGEDKGSMLVIGTRKGQIVYSLVRQLLRRGVSRLYYAIAFEALDDIENCFVCIHLLEGGLETILIEYNEEGIVREVRHGLAHEKMSMTHLEQTVLTRVPQFQ